MMIMEIATVVATHVDESFYHGGIVKKSQLNRILREKKDQDVQNSR